jgi:hypothetical protein
MSDPHDPKNSELSHIYREAGWPEPGRQIDEAILAASRRAARAQSSFARRWFPPFALAATVLLTFTLVLRVYEEQPETASPSILEKRSASSAAEPASPPAAEKPKSAPEAKPVLPAQTAPASTLSTPAIALKKEAPDAARANRTREIEESLRARYQSAPPLEPQPERPPAPMAAPLRADKSPSPQPTQAAPAASAGFASGGAAGEAATGAISIRRSDAPERSPQTWLEDIRRLKAQSRTEEAERELAEFRKRYPDFLLPDDLR